MAGITFPCIGVCNKAPGWRDPDTGLACTCCGGSGAMTVYSQRELDEKAWEGVRASRLSAADRAEKRKAARRAA